MMVPEWFYKRMIDAIEQKKLRERFNPEGSLLRQYQLKMLEMLKYIDEVCRKYQIRYWLCSGTLLGAVRHGGFIPWDDDVDIEMLRDDYKKFIHAMENEPQINYALQTHCTDRAYLAPYAKLRDLHSLIKENNTNDLYYKYKGCYIDVFIMESSSSLVLNRASNFLQNSLLFYPNACIKNKFCREIYLNAMFWILNKLVFPSFRLFSKIGAKGQLRHTFGSCFTKKRDKDDIFPLTNLKFEDCSFPVPGNYDAYLKKIYGSYMNLPDLDKIVMHTVEVEL